MESEMISTKRTNTKGRVNSISKSEAVAKRSISCDSRLNSSRKRDSSMDTAIERKTKEKIDSSYILLSQVKNIKFKKFILLITSIVFIQYVECYRKNIQNTKLL